MTATGPSLLDYALRYAERGWLVHPLHSPGRAYGSCDCRGVSCESPAKHPRTMNGLKDATTDAEKIRTWWTMWPQANVGVATGPQSGIVVVDVDPRDGGDAELFELVQANELLPWTPTANTGGGGQHYFFKHPGGRLQSRKLGGMKGIDVKSDGGYVVAPRSLHATRIAYEWVPDSEQAELAEIPAWLLAMMRGPADVSVATSDVPERVLKGGRNQTLTSLAGSLRHRGVTQEALFAALSALNLEICVPPLEQEEVAKIAASVSRYEPEPETPVVVSKPIGKRVQRPVYVPEIFTADELLQKTLPDVRWAVPNLLPEGLAVLAGKPKLGKSWLALHIGIAIAQGSLVMDTIPAPSGDVLMLLLEDNLRRLKDRINLLLRGERPPQRLHMEIRWPREDEGGLDTISDWLDAHPDARFVVIDTLAKFRERVKDAKYSDDYAAIEGLQQLAGKHGVCILLIHHLRKALADDWVDTISGTLGIAGAADSLMGLDRQRGQMDAVLRVTGRDVEDQELALLQDKTTMQWNILGDADDYRRSKERGELIVALEDEGKPTHFNTLASIIGKTREAVGRACRRAASDGQIVSYGNGMFGALSVHHDITPPDNGGSRTARTAADSEKNDLLSAEGLAIDRELSGINEPIADSDVHDLSAKTAVRAVRAVRLESARTDGQLIARARQNGTGWPKNDTAPEQRCPTCGGTDWTKRINGHWQCAACQPHLRLVGEQEAT